MATSKVPHRKPGTPLNEFYSLGKYPSELKQKEQSERLTVARPGGAASLVDRNKRGQDVIDIKPSIHSRHDQSFYKPNKYLNARQEHIESSTDHQGISHAHGNMIFNMQKSNKEHKSVVPLGGATMNESDAKFMNQRNSATIDRSSSDKDNLFRLNVSRRRQIGRGLSIDSKPDFEFKRNSFNNTVKSESRRNTTSFVN